MKIASNYYENLLKARPFSRDDLFKRDIVCGMPPNLSLTSSNILKSPAIAQWSTLGTYESMFLHNITQSLAWFGA